MAQLTAEDVLRRTFTSSEHGGYDVTEVDEYLDEVAATLAQHAQASSADEPAAAASLLAAASRLHDEHLAAAHAQADELLTAAHQAADELVSHAQEVAARELGDLQTQREALQADVERLKAFEADYRAQVRSRLQGLLEQIPDPS